MFTKIHGYLMARSSWIRGWDDNSEIKIQVHRKSSWSCAFPMCAFCSHGQVGRHLAKSSPRLPHSSFLAVLWINCTRWWWGVSRPHLYSMTVHMCLGSSLTHSFTQELDSSSGVTQKPVSPEWAIWEGLPTVWPGKGKSYPYKCLQLLLQL